jgi:hypothetical protein
MPQFRVNSGTTQTKRPPEGSPASPKGIVVKSLTGLFFDFAHRRAIPRIFHNDGRLCFNAATGACSGDLSATAITTAGGGSIIAENGNVEFASVTAAVPGHMGDDEPGLLHISAQQRRAGFGYEETVFGRSFCFGRLPAMRTGSSFRRSTIKCTAATDDDQPGSRSRRTRL